MPLGVILLVEDLEAQMKKILYTATDQAGREVNGYVQAASVSAAIAQLNEDGFTDVTLHDDPIMAIEDKGLEGLSPSELRRRAAFEIKARQGVSLGSCLLESIRNNWALVLTGVILLYWGCAEASWTLSMLGTAIALFAPAFTLWKLRDVRRYEAIHFAFAVGDWGKAKRNIELLRASTKNRDIEFDLDVREACVLAKEEHLDQGLKLVEPRKVEMDATNPGAFEGRVASIHYAAGDEQSYLSLMQDSYFKSSCNPMICIDLALAEARFGDPEKVSLLLDRLNKQEITPLAGPFIDWARGVASCRLGEDQSLVYLNKALSGMAENSANPAALITTALCAGYYAAAMINVGRKEEAELLLQEYRQILEVHADARLLKEISFAFESR